MFPDPRWAQNNHLKIFDQPARRQYQSYLPFICFLDGCPSAFSYSLTVADFFLYNRPRCHDILLLAHGPVNLSRSVLIDPGPKPQPQTPAHSPAITAPAIPCLAPCPAPPLPLLHHSAVLSRGCTKSHVEHIDACATSKGFSARRLVGD
jgi:hypothetical protein